MFESGGGNCQMQIVTKLPNENIQKLPTRNVRFWWGGGVNYQMQIVTKLPNENIQNYQLEMFNSGGSVNCQMQIVTNYQMKISKTTN